MLAERRTDRNTPQLQPQQQLEWENHLKPSPPSLNNCRVRYGNYYSLLPLCSGFHVTLLCFSHFFIFCFSVSLPHLTLAHFAAEAASENPKCTQRGQTALRHFSTATAHLPSPSRLFPSLPAAINLGNQPRSPVSAERAGAASMKKRRRRAGGRLREWMEECGCLTFKARAVWTL